MASGFARRSASGVVYYAARALEHLPGVRHGFSTRQGGVGPPPDGDLNLGRVPWDAPDHVAENRSRFLGALGLDLASLVTLTQIHSNRLRVVEEAAPAGNRPELEGDSLVTRAPGLALGIHVADCFPVILATADGEIVANVHAGWRGTVARLAAGTVEAVRGLGGARIVAALGPGIRACCFEVGSEVAELFDRAFPARDLVRPARGAPGKFRVDLPAALDTQLTDAGVTPGDVHDLGACTRCAPAEFFSYRREGARSGRLMAVVARGGEAGLAE
jgi:YfiH family protein